jgi:hypothetical protein
MPFGDDLHLAVSHAAIHGPANQRRWRIQNSARAMVSA